jgi:hypothetical protein
MEHTGPLACPPDHGRSIRCCSTLFLHKFHGWGLQTLVAILKTFCPEFAGPAAIIDLLKCGSSLNRSANLLFTMLNQTEGGRERAGIQLRVPSVT